jgi:hypothetical protein
MVGIGGVQRGRGRRPGLLDERLVLRVACQEEVEAGGEDVLGGGAGHGVGEREARGLQLLQERPRDRDVEAGLRGGERLDGEAAGRDGLQLERRGSSPDPGEPKFNRLNCGRRDLRRGGRRCVAVGRRRDGRDRRRARPNHGDHVTARDDRTGGQLGGDLLRLLLRAVEEPGEDLGTVLGGDDPRQLDDAAHAEVALPEGVEDLRIALDEVGGGLPVVRCPAREAEVADRKSKRLE